MSYHGHVESGVVVLDEAPDLPEGAGVCVELLPQSETVVYSAPEDETIPTLYERLKVTVHGVRGQSFA